MVYKNIDTKVDTKKCNIYKIFENYLNKSIDYNRIDMIEKSIKNGIKIYKKDLVRIKVKALKAFLENMILKQIIILI